MGRTKLRSFPKSGEENPILRFHIPCRRSFEKRTLLSEQNLHKLSEQWNARNKKGKTEQTLFFSHWAFSGQSLAMWSLALQMKQLSPGFIPGTLRGCFLKPFLWGLFGSLVEFDSSFLRLNLLFFFFFLSGSFGGVGSAIGNSSGCSSLYFFRASLCLWLTIFTWKRALQDRMVTAPAMRFSQQTEWRRGLCKWV